MSAPARVRGIVTVDLSDLDDYPSTEIVRQRMSVIEACADGTPVRLLIGVVKASSAYVAGIAIGHAFLQIEGASPDLVAQWVEMAGHHTAWRPPWIPAVDG